MQTGIKLILVFISLGFCVFAANGQSTKDSNTFKIIGYYSLQSALKADNKNVPFNKLTHINLYFLNPDSNGVFPGKLSELSPFINTAHAKNVKVLASIGSGGKHAYYAKLLKDTYRQTLINNLVAIVRQTDLDGIDVDIEGNDIDENYDNFVIELTAALHQEHKLITAAVAVYFKNDYTDKALAQFDFINLMSYDHTGAWAPQKPGPHSTYDQAVEDLSYFRMMRNIAKEKIVLGVPFYGYGYGPTLTTRGLTLNYDHIVSDYPGAEFTDEFDIGEGKTLYYNGMPTMKLKTNLAKHEASGIMIWQISGDASAPKSLLDVIYQSSRENK
ncbi:MAG TPA: glycosyl hydrolase family 18 protein [Panacibacter sp.]|mgnify:FL=1|nr:glycosyl hydrolase family 18 protein [Panacibacter sp.]HNP44619.1 glycosyl hydrolase family 18 protein [Panacibacter sp.]